MAMPMAHGPVGHGVSLEFAQKQPESFEVVDQSLILPLGLQITRIPGDVTGRSAIRLRGQYMESQHNTINYLPSTYHVAADPAIVTIHNGSSHMHKQSFNHSYALMLDIRNPVVVPLIGDCRSP